MWSPRPRDARFLAALVLGGSLILVSIGAAPHTSLAEHSYSPMSIIINEVAWGGTLASAADEWIELYNPGTQSIDLTGWRLVGGKPITNPDPDISLTGTIPPGCYYLLERTDDNTISDVTADKIYTGYLDNDPAGEIIFLYDSTGTLIDSANLDGGSWPAGSASPDYYSMERIGLNPDDPGAWLSNNGITRNGLDAGDVNGNNKRPINGTPRQPNSATLLSTGTPTFTTSNTPTDTNTPTNTFTPTFSEAPTLTSTSTPTYTFTLTPTNTHTNTPTTTASRTPTSIATTTPIAPGHIVISEFRSRGPKGADDEFVELYNATGGAIDISGWKIRRSGDCTNSVYNLATITDSIVLEPGQHYLVAASQSSIANADQTYSASLADTGGLALVDTFGVVVDEAGMCASTQFYEGTYLNPLSGTSDQSYERRLGGDTACYDTENNAADFTLISPSNPQNKSSPGVMCFGVPLSTLTYTPTFTPTYTLTPTRTSSPTRTPSNTRTPTITPTIYPGLVFINEFLPRPHTDWNADGAANSRDEYIEIINLGTASISLKNWKLDDGDGGSSAYTLPDLTLQPRQIAHFFGAETGISLSDGGDTVRLIKPDGHVADSRTYSVVGGVDQTWCRIPDGDGDWAFTCRPTPGRLNARLASSTPVQGSALDSGAATNCLSPSTASSSAQPQGCKPSHPGTSDEESGGPIWLPCHWKWCVFVE